MDVVNSFLFLSQMQVILSFEVILSQKQVILKHK